MSKKYIPEITIFDPRQKDATGTSPSSHRNMIKTGFEAIGVSVNPVSYVGYVSTRHVVCWGWRNGERFRRKGYQVLVMERGYIGDRFKYTSLGLNGLNNHADFPDYPDDGGQRFREHGGILKPWKKDGDYILILGQVRGDASLQGKDMSAFYREVAEKAKSYGVPVYFRPHPESVRRGGYSSIPGIQNLTGSLHVDLSKALFTIAYNSNSCLDSILHGVPCYAGDRGTMAYDLCMKDINQVVYPEREQILNRIAWTQWSPEEIKSGLPLRKFKEML